MPVEGLEPTPCRQERILNPSRDFTSQSTTDTYKRYPANPSTGPSSQTQQTGQTDAQSTAIERELGKLADVDRDAMTRHVIALATISKKRRHAILTLTEKEV